MERKLKGDKVRWGIIGVGDVCEVKSAPAMQVIDDSELVAVMRRNGDKAADYARRHGVPRWYDDADALIADADVNAIYIATPPNAHAALTTKAALAGKPVYVEKPMARTHTECLEMIDVCETEGVPLYVAYYRRTLPNFLQVKEWVEAGKIGDVRAVRINLVKTLQPDLVADVAVNWRVDPAIAGGGYFYDLASHQLDFLDFLLGPITRVHGCSANQAGKYPAEDIVCANWQWPGGIMGQGFWCFTSAEVSQDETTVILGSKGEIRYQNFGDNKVHLLVDGQPPVTTSFDMPKHIQEPLIQTVVDDLLGRGVCPSMGRTAARTNLVMEQMVRT